MAEIVFDGIHLASLGGDLEALHRFASLVGLRRSWFQGSNPLSPHYDITSAAIARRIREEGALIIPVRLMSRYMMAGRLAPAAPVLRKLGANEEQAMLAEAENPCPVCGNRHQHLTCPEVVSGLLNWRRRTWESKTRQG